jgi:CRISPR/Cas system-associated exonuclease Cas4 (RecB family)
MQLISIQDLTRPRAEIDPIISQARMLEDLYEKFIRQDIETYEYTVIDFGEKTREPGIHASEISKCLRRLVYGILGTERKTIAEKVDPNLKMRFRMGTALHAMLQNDFHRMAKWFTEMNQAQGFALTFEDEVSIKPHLQQVSYEWGLNSSCDGVFTFWWLCNGVWVRYLRVGVEIKSSSAPSYESRRKPEADHAEQTCLYQACLDLPLMWVLYYNKSNSNFTGPRAPWLFEFNSNLWERELKSRFYKAYQHAQANNLPDRTPGNHCGFCPFAHTCNPPTASSKRQSQVVSLGLPRKRL